MQALIESIRALTEGKRWWVRPLKQDESPPGSSKTWWSQGYRVALVNKGRVFNVFKTLPAAQKALKNATSKHPPKKGKHPPKVKVTLDKDDFYFSGV